MILYSVSAYGGYADDKKTRFAEPQGYDFTIKLDEQDATYIGLPVKNIPDMIVRVLRNGYFDDIVFAFENSLSTPTREQTFGCITIADELDCGKIAMANDVDKAICELSLDQTHEILLYACAYHNAVSHAYDGYREAVFMGGRKVIEKTENIVSGEFNDWVACEDISANIAEAMISKYTRFDDNTDVSEEFAQACAEMMSDSQKEAAFAEMREMMIESELPIDATVRVKAGSYSNQVDDVYSLRYTMKMLAQPVQKYDK